MLVRFADDPQLLHWRGILHAVGGDQVVVVTPDRDIEITVLQVGNIYTEILRYDRSRLPAGVRERDTYLPKHSDQGSIGNEEFRRLIALGQRHAAARVERRRVSGKVSKSGEVVDDLARPAVRRPAEETGHRDDRVLDDEQGMNLVVYRSSGGPLGEELNPPADSTGRVVNGKIFNLFSANGEEFLVQRVAPGDVSRMQGLLHWGDAAAGFGERDVRVLPVLFDNADERWRTIPEAAGELEEVEYDDFPLQGPRTLCHDVRQLRRLGFDFVQHHESWIKKSGVRSSDRSVFEHATICRVLNLMVCYDQLNVGALASAEALNRRRTLIEQAHQGRPDAPSYESAEDIMGIRESLDGSLIDPALTQYAARKAATRAEIMKQTRLAQEEKKHLRKNEDVRDPDHKKGKGKNKSQGGSEAPQNP